MNAHTDNTGLALRASTALARRNNYWIAIRQAGKEARLSFTAAIAEFNLYEDAEGGSTAPERAFSNFTRTIYAPFGLNKKQVEDKMDSRDDLDVIVLDALRLIEGSAASIIYEGMAKSRSRREIKEAVKAYAVQIAATVVRVGRGTLRAAVLRDWCDTLEGWKPDSVLAALRKWRNEHPSKRPNPGHILAMLKESWGRRHADQVRAAMAPPVEPPKERVSPDAAKAIMAEMGVRDPLAAKTVSGIQPTE